MIHALPEESTPQGDLLSLVEDWSPTSTLMKRLEDAMLRVVKDIFDICFGVPWAETAPWVSAGDNSVIAILSDIAMMSISYSVASYLDGGDEYEDADLEEGEGGEDESGEHKIDPDTDPQYRRVRSHPSRTSRG